MKRKSNPSRPTPRSPTPWRLQDEPSIGVNGLPVALVVDGAGLPVANCGDGPVGRQNARLIALAPYVLTTLMAALNEHPDPMAEDASPWVRHACGIHDILWLGHEGE